MNLVLRPSGGGAVMASRREPPDSLDYFPTPPWATRAFLHTLFLHTLDGADWQVDRHHIVLEPACGEGHMAHVLRERFDTVIATDIFPYGYGRVQDFLDPDYRPVCDWIMTNPPFNRAVPFVEKGLSIARQGVAVLVRSAWLESEERFRLFERHFPTVIFQYADRVPMTKGRWDPKAKSATSYCWVVFSQRAKVNRRLPLGQWGVIPFGAKKRFHRPADLRFARTADAPLLQGVR